MHPAINKIKIWYLYLILTILVMSGSLFQLEIVEKFVKPLLMPVLILIVINNMNQSWHKNLLIIGLFCSALGDIFLLKTNNSNYFILGLMAFLLTHICYIIIFFSEIKFKTLTKLPILISLITVCYVLIFYQFSHNKLGLMQIPVLIYMIIIALMVICAGFRSPKGNSYYWILLGALSFVISDSILAIDKFLKIIPQAQTMIILSYIIAQYAIVKGKMLDSFAP